MNNLPIFRIILASLATLFIFRMASFPGWISSAIVLSVLIVVSVSYLHSFFPGRLSIYAKLALVVFIAMTLWGKYDSTGKRVLSEALKSSGVTSAFRLADKISSDYDNEGALSHYDERKKIIDKMSMIVQAEEGVIGAKVKDSTDWATLQKGLKDLEDLDPKRSEIDRELKKTKLFKKGESASSFKFPSFSGSARNYGGSRDFGGAATEEGAVTIDHPGKYIITASLTPIPVRTKGCYHIEWVARGGTVVVTLPDGRKINQVPGKEVPIPGNNPKFQVSSLDEKEIGEFVLTVTPGRG